MSMGLILFDRSKPLFQYDGKAFALFPDHLSGSAEVDQFYLIVI